MRVLSVKYAVPQNAVTNLDILEEFKQRVGHRVDTDTLSKMQQSLSRTLEFVGSKTRYHRSGSEKALDFGVTAGRAALAEAKLEPEDIDLLLFVGVGRGFIEPATANLFQFELGCRRATCFDILDACASWLRAVEVVQHYLRCGTAGRAMIINCEFNFREYANWNLNSLDDLETAWSAFTIGEAATATILTHDSEDEDFHIRFENAGQDYHLCHIPLPNFDQFHRAEPGREYPALKFFSNSAGLTKRALKMLADQFNEDPLFHGQRHDAIFTHSASTKISVSGIRSIGLDPELLHDPFPRFGNTVSAALPLAMADAIESGVLRRDERVLMLMGSAGVAAGLCTFTY